MISLFSEIFNVLIFLTFYAFKSVIVNLDSHVNPDQSCPARLLFLPWYHDSVKPDMAIIGELSGS